VADVTDALTLRPVTGADEGLLLEWANDPMTRAASRAHEPIAPVDHHRWLERRLASPHEARLWIGEVDGRPMGVVRFERRAPSDIEVSITVAPIARGRGLARPLLDAGIAAAHAAFGRVRILADILPGNDASVALFTGAGFAPTHAASGAAGPGEPPVISLELR
jgi:RimJ/RimL family protein N-acetyltransferase